MRKKTIEDDEERVHEFKPIVLYMVEYRVRNSS